MSDDDGLRAFRHKLAEAVFSRLNGEIDGLSAHFGESYEQSSDPEALLYHRIGGSFRFLAFAFAPWRMWDLHVGTLPVGSSALSAGYHISDRTEPVLMEELRRLAAARRIEIVHKEKAVEFQANLPPIPVSPENVAPVADAVCGLCRDMAKVAAAIPCPPGMRA